MEVTINNDLKYRIIGFLEAGRTQMDAATFYGLHQSSISRIWKKFQTSNKVSDYQNCGRKTKTNQLEQSLIIEKIQKRNSTCEKVAAELMEESGKTISRQTVLRIAKAEGLVFANPKIIPFLSDKNKQIRMEYCQKLKDDDLSQLVFTDESYFQLSPNTHKQWIYPNTQVEARYHRKAPGIMIWGGISREGKTRLWIQSKKESITSELYIKILEEELLPFAKDHYPGQFWRLVQDNARPHKSRLSMKFLSENVPILLLHPPYSPDLNPIETIWAIMKNALKQISVTSIKELKTVVNQVWNSITIETINKLLYNHREKIKKVLEAKGNFSSS